ncbi:GPI-anchored protein [Actinidia chinensis var. chinensis]|uniref:GPI-anchored protein n=1 Tax=Actinidia chinensis var. chinensis TaxID=1590841 RepID=A0A2R6P612_ACTCC|nr:GPI-anchored protein [Actinidia chinensis var. chinensis]
MASLYTHHLLLLFPILLLSSQVKSIDEKESLLQGLNTYRASLNLTALTKNSNGDCFAEELANQFKKQPCSNTTGADTVLGTEPQLSTYPDLLAKCHLNITDTRDGQIMPVCVPNLVPNLVLANFTETQYTQYLNDSSFTGAGIGSEGDWMVVVLSTNTVGGSFTPAQNTAYLFPSLGLAQILVPVLLGFILVLLR